MPQVGKQATGQTGPATKLPVFVLDQVKDIEIVSTPDIIIENTPDIEIEDVP